MMYTIRVSDGVDKVIAKWKKSNPNLFKKMKVAVMGCVVNGPGEAREADLGIAGGDGVGLIFRRGEIIKKVPQEQLVDALMDEIAQYEGE